VTAVRAFDELRFGPQRTLNLRENLPTAPDAVRRAESWLREQQVRGSGEVLIITGRGNQSLGGVAVIRAAVEKLLFSLKRRGVVASHREHNPGAFAVELAPLRSLVEAPARRRDRAPKERSKATIQGLSAESVQLLRDLAGRSLDALGVKATEARLADEMQRHLRAIAPALPGGERMEPQLRAALTSALEDYDSV
jgi:Smr domain